MYKTDSISTLHESQMADSDDSDGDLIIDERISFESCPHKFRGTVDKVATEDFISKIENFKHKHRITNETALKDLEYLFHDQTLAWWEGVKNAVKSWDDAITLIRYVYAPSKPAHTIYSEIFQQSQGSEKLDVFLRRLRKLFLQLPKPHPEEVQLDMIYFMLNQFIRANIPRETVDSFDQLIQKGRELDADSTANVRRRTRVGQRKRCGNCRLKGHVTHECKKIKLKNPQDMFRYDAVDVQEE